MKPINKWMIATAAACTIVANAEPVCGRNSNGTVSACSSPMVITAAPASRSDLTDITLDEARSLIADFRINAWPGADGSTSALEISGRIPGGCVDSSSMRIQNSINDQEFSTIAPHGKISFRISMTSEARDCLKREKDRIISSRNTNGMRPLRDLGIGNLRIQDIDFGDQGVVFFSDGFTQSVSEFNPPLRTISRARLAKERADAERAQRNTLIAKLHRQYEKCQGSVDSLQTAREAVQRLLDLSAINSQEYDVRMAKLDEAEKKSVYNDLKKRIENGTYEELADVREELRDFAESNPELAQHAAHLSVELARRALEAEGEVSVERYAFSDSVLADAQEFDLDAKQIKNVKHLRAELEVEKVSYYARSGDMGSMMLFQFNYPRLAMNAWKQVQSNCYGRRPKMEDCATSMKVHNRIQQLPQELNEGQHRLQQNNLNQTRMMQAAMGVGGFNSVQPQQQWMPGQQSMMPTSMASFDSRGMFGFVPSTSLAPSYTYNTPSASQGMGPFVPEVMSPSPITVGSPWN